MSSTKTQLPYEYYDLPFCKKKNARTTSENLGDVLVGDSVTVSPYDVSAVPHHAGEQFLSLISPLAIWLCVRVGSCT